MCCEKDPTDHSDRRAHHNTAQTVVEQAEVQRVALRRRHWICEQKERADTATQNCERNANHKRPQGLPVLSPCLLLALFDDALPHNLSLPHVLRVHRLLCCLLRCLFRG